jgi:hypothetical protein
MYNLANRIEVKDEDGHVVRTIPGAPVPIPASEIELEEFKVLNDANLDFANRLLAGNEFFFKSSDGKIDRDPAITSFLCTDQAYELFETGGQKLDSLSLRFEQFPFKDQIPTNQSTVLTNKECLAEARKFFEYVDIEGYRGSPHKL